MLRILIVDDHAIVRQGLKQILADTPDMVVAGEASNGQEALNEALKSHYDVVCLDISMPGRSGLDILKELRSQNYEFPILVLSMHPEEQYAIRVLRAGGSGYITKESAPDELVTAIRKVASGGKYVSSSLAEKLALYLETGAEGPLQQALSDREYQVMCMIASGKTGKDIARELSLSPKTISTYRSRILEKMKMKNDAELTHYAVQNGLVT